MKIRIGFISNSSSSSFTCDCCETTKSGYGASLADFEMIACDNEHICCEHHLNVGLDDPRLIETYLRTYPEHRKYNEYEMLAEIRDNFPS